MGPLLSRAASAPVPSLLKSPTAPNAAFAPGLAVPSLARNATHCRQAQRGLFLQPHSALFQGLFGQQHFAYRFVGIQHEVSEILFVYAHFLTCGLEESQSLSALHPPHLPG